MRKFEWYNKDDVKKTKLNRTNLMLMQEYIDEDKQEKEEGKGLSANDYTTTEKNKLKDIETQAQVNLIEAIQKNGEVIEITDKTANIIVSKTDIGLGNVDNTNDIDKPVSNATRTELDKKLDRTDKVTENEALEGVEDTKFMTALKSKKAIDKALEGYTPRRS